MQELIFDNDVAVQLDQLIERLAPQGVYIIADVNTDRLVVSRLRAESRYLAEAPSIVVKDGDINKNLESLSVIWKQLGTLGASRHSLVLNVGGGVVTDMGGFAAATFKRGIPFINIPTTLLGAVDAAVGGKTGINFNGYKNEVGAFAPADAVILSTIYFATLPKQEILSGYAEMLKHGLLAGRKIFDELLGYSVTGSDNARLLTLLEESVKLKVDIVDKDPNERGLRKALNLGHTVGHAFESLAMSRLSPVPHGYAVAWGLVVELVLSHIQLGFSSEYLHRFAAYVLSNYGAFDITCRDYPELLRLMRHDKKNLNPDTVNFTLLIEVGDPVLNSTATDDDIKTALDLYRDLFHI